MIENDKPECWDSGVCEHSDQLAICIHCGCEMFEEDGNWYTHEQADIPIEDRKIHL